MAFEGIFTGLGVRRGIEPFDGDAAFDAAGGVAGVVGHAGDGTGHEFKGGFAALPGV